MCRPNRGEVEVLPKAIRTQGVSTTIVLRKRVNSNLEGEYSGPFSRPLVTLGYDLKHFPSSYVVWRSSHACTFCAGEERES
jgi:hypothetical protein